MKVVIQRVKEAKVQVDNLCVGSIQHGYLILLGIGHEDTKELVERYVEKIVKLRIFADEDGKTNRSIEEVRGEVLVVSQFTLYADCRRGNRPDFIGAAKAQWAEELYEYFVTIMRGRIGKVETGRFGEDMQVSLVNDGPFTIILDDNTVS